MKKSTICRAIINIFIISHSSCMLQNNVLYHPDKQKPPQDYLSQNNIEFWGSHSDDYRGYVSTIQIPDPKGTVIVFHGNAGSAADRVCYLQALTPLGFRVILAEYPGYGGRKGEPGETAIVRDAKETVSFASGQFGGHIFLLGESLGCGVTAAAVKDLPVQIDGIILITPWDTLLSVAKEKFPWLPVRLLLKDRYDSIDNLKSFKGRVAVAGAEHDMIIPVWHAHKLYEAISNDKRMWIINRAGHNDWFDHVDLSWWQSVMDFAAGRN